MALGRACPPSPLLELGGGTARERKRGAAPERGGRQRTPSLPGTGMCCFQRVDVLLAWIEPLVDDEGVRVAFIPQSLSPRGGRGAPHHLVDPPTA